MGAAGSPLKRWENVLVRVSDGCVRCRNIGHSGMRKGHPAVEKRLHGDRRFQSLRPRSLTQRPIKGGERQPHPQGEFQVHGIINGEAMRVRELEGLCARRGGSWR